MSLLSDSNTKTSTVNKILTFNLEVQNRVCFFNGDIIDNPLPIDYETSSIINAMKKLNLINFNIFNDLQAGPLLGSGIGLSSRAGKAVAISGDGMTAVSASASANNIWIFTNVDGIWKQEVETITVFSSDVFNNQMLALSHDGNTLAVGRSVAGNTFVYNRIGVNWVLTTLTGTGAIGASQQGYSVSLSADGNTLAVGGIQDNAFIGATWIFRRTNGVWSQNAKLVGTGNVGASRQGYSVSLSADGNTLAVGGIQDNAFRGAAWIFKCTNGVWSQVTKLVGTGNIGFARQGYSISLSADGNTVAVGGAYDNSFIGATWIFKGTNGIWSQITKLVPNNYYSTLGDVLIGNSVSINHNGTFLAMSGTVNNNYNGCVWFFSLVDNVWTQLNYLDMSDNENSLGSFIEFGSSISMTSDNQYIAVGSRSYNDEMGAMFIFKY